MQWTGNVGRTLGQVLLALGIIALVLGVVGLVFGGLILRDAANGSADPDAGDFFRELVAGSFALTAAGTLGVVLAIVVLGLARALRERHQRKAAAPAPAPAPAN